MAGATASIEISATDLAPKGPLGSSVWTKITSVAGVLAARGDVVFAKAGVEGLPVSIKEHFFVDTPHT